MKIIDSIRIRYFRSILTTTRGNQSFTKTNDLNIIVGSNDAGKSNYLKALNLFFNNQSDPNLPFNFWNEFSQQRHGVRKEKNRIEIELIINPPKRQNIKHYGQVRWQKIWKHGSDIPHESIEYINGHPFTRNRRSAFYKWLKKIRFRYVPAIKSKKYFDDLMYVLYDVLQKDTLALEKEFNTQVGEKTNLISKEINNRLNIDSVLQFKGSFRDLFLNLEFGSKDGRFMLSQRGDGVKVRHIPIILQNIAEAELKEERRREPIASTIWGFEEPENNLEFASARKLALSFLEYIKSTNFENNEKSVNDEGIQIFLTTHSPIFYTLSSLGDERISAFLVNKNKDESSSIRNISSGDSIVIENEMKLLPLIELSKHWKNVNLKISSLEQSKVELEKQLDSFSDQEDIIFLTEDKNMDLIRILLTSNGFNLDNIDLRSYGGCTNIGSAEILQKYLEDKFKDRCPIIMVHRDKDYLTDKEVKSEIRKYAKKKIKLFITKGTDIESYFTNYEHLSFCNPEIDQAEIIEITESSKREKVQKAIDLIRIKEFGNRHKNKDSHFDDYLLEYYNKNEDKFFHGKEVLKTIRGKFQEKYKRNIQIRKVSEYLFDSNLSALDLL